MRGWIKEKRITRSQFISMTMNETRVGDVADNLMTLFYRKKARILGEVPMKDLGFKQFDQMRQWNELIEAAGDLGETDLLSVIHSPKSIGNCQNQIVWYMKGSNQCNLKWIKRTDGDWSALFLELRDWLNTYVAPHQLVSVSIFEGAHPNT